MDGYKIRKVSNGFVVESGILEKVFITLDEVLADMLLHFEGRSSTFTGKSYGIVTISREQS